ADHVRQSLAAELGRRGEAGPAAFHVLLVGLPETRRGPHLAGALVEAAALAVTHLVEWRQDRTCEAGGFLQHGVDQLASGLLVPECRQYPVHAQYVVQRELHVADRGLVAVAHVVLSYRMGSAQHAGQPGGGAEHTAAWIGLEAALLARVGGRGDRALEGVFDAAA